MTVVSFIAKQECDSHAHWWLRIHYEYVGKCADKMARMFQLCYSSAIMIIEASVVNLTVHRLMGTDSLLLHHSLFIPIYD